MKATNHRRVDKLEQRNAPPPRIVVVGVGEYDTTEAELDARVAALDVRPDDIVIRVVYTRNWNCPELEDLE